MLQSKYLRVLRFVMHYWLLSPVMFALLVVARLGSTLVDVSVPMASGKLVDAVANGARDNPWPAFHALGIFIGLGALYQSSRQIVTFLLNRMSARAITAIGRDAFAKVQRFSAEWHSNSFAGSTVRKISRGMASFDSFTDTVAFGLLPTLIVIVGATVTFVWRWPILGLVVAVAVFVFLAVTLTLSILWVRPANIAAREWDSRLSGVIADSITGNQTVKSFAAEEREDRLFADTAANWERRAIISWDRSAVSGLAQAALLVVLQIGMLGTGLYLWSRKQAGPGDIASLIAMQFLIAGYLRNVGQQIRTVQRTINDMDDVIAFRDTTVQIADAPGAKPLEVRQGHIIFDRVTFAYAGMRDPLYHDFSIEIPAGQRVGLVGPSGAGKSTFVKLIQRLYDVDDGRILVDGQDIAKVTQTSLRMAVGLVPQDPILFHRSLAENIGYGRPAATREAIASAARLAHANLFIDGLTSGYDTLVGERGIKLSGGERQRVAIARAILAATPILILDEATSSLDSVSEHYIREAMEQLSSGRTTIVIAHRLSTVQQLDRLLVFDRGRIVEDGTHSELLRRPNGVYRHLLETQNGFLFEAAE